VSATPNLDGCVFNVATTAAAGVVDAETRLVFRQRGDRVHARYAGGRVRRGHLIGRLSGTKLTFRYAQVEDPAALHAGRSVCDLEPTEDGRWRIREHFLAHAPGLRHQRVRALAPAHRRRELTKEPRRRAAQHASGGWPGAEGSRGCAQPAVDA
jgi:hypothetical protein